jgi:hypothetical protein
MGTFAQRELDKVTEQNAEPMVSLHDIYCPCPCYVVVREESNKELDGNK